MYTAGARSQACAKTLGSIRKSLPDPMNQPRLLAVPTFSLTQLTQRIVSMTWKNPREAATIERIHVFAYTCWILVPAILHEHASEHACS